LNDKSSSKQLQFKGNPIRSIAFVHCVGSRQVAGVHEPGADGKINEYCSRVCCSAILHSMRTIGERFPDTQVYDFYRDIRTYGRGQESIYEQVSKQGALFFRFTAQDPPVVTPAEPGDDATLRVTVNDVLTWNEPVAVGVDLVVLATGMVPSDITSLVDSLKLPIGADRFLLEAHPKLRPVEIATNGIFLAGSCQAPMDATEAAAAAGAAASKAAILLSQSELQLDPFVAEVNQNKCTGCGDCLSECSYEGAIALQNVGEKTVAVVNAALCKGCGACAAVCKPRALDVAGWSIEQMESMVDAIAAS
jgi:heterodisulfide reductase subunit A